MTQYISHSIESLKTHQKFLNIPSVIPLTAGNELIGKEVVGQELITQELLLHPSSFFKSRELVPLGDRPDSYLVLAQKESGWYYYLLMDGLIYLIDFYSQQGQRIAVVGSDLVALCDELLSLWDERSKFIVLSKGRSVFRWRQIVIEIILITRDELPSSQLKVLDKGGRKMLEMPSNLALRKASGVLDNENDSVDMEIIRQMFADERGLPASQPELPCSQNYLAVQPVHNELHKPRGFEIEIEIAYNHPALPYRQALPSSQPALMGSAEIVPTGPLDIAVRERKETALQPCYGFEIEIELQARRALQMANELPSPPVDCTSLVPYCQDLQHRYGWEVEVHLGKDLSTRALHSSNALPVALPFPSIKAQESCTALMPYKGASLIPCKENSLVLYNRSASTLTLTQRLDLNLASHLRKLAPSSRLQLLKPIELTGLEYVSTLVPKFSDPNYETNFHNMEIATQKLVSRGPQNFTQVTYPLKFRAPAKKMKALKPFKSCLKKETSKKTSSALERLGLKKPSKSQEIIAAPTASFDDLKKKMASRILESQFTSLTTYRMKNCDQPQSNALVPYYKDSFDKKLEHLCKVCKNKLSVDAILKKHFHNRLAINYTTTTDVNPVHNTSLTTQLNTNLSNHYRSVDEVEILSEDEQETIHHRGSVESEEISEEILNPDVGNISFEESELDMDDPFFIEERGEEEKEELLLRGEPGILEDEYEICLNAQQVEQNDKEYDVLQQVDIADCNFEILN